jgi:methylglutaconyl-CoA hydratase
MERAPQPAAGPVISHVAAEVGTLTLNNPERRNALSADMVDGLYDGLARFMADDAVRVVVLANTGPVFCAGADLGGNGRTARHELADLLRAVLDSPKPVVGRVDGDCYGGGVGLAAACDIVVARDDARFAFTEVRLGVAAAVISVVCLPKLSRGDARRLLLTGERIDGRRAAAVGLITDAVPADRLDEAVDGFVQQVRLGGPQALAATKQLLEVVPTLPRDESFDWATRLSKELFGSAEAAEGFAAFRERRLPSWAAAEAEG